MLTFYRYISHSDEVSQVQQERRIQSTNPRTGRATWYTTARYDDPLVAQRELALDRAPTHRVGPIPADQMPPFDRGPRDAATLGGRPGGALEVRTTFPVWLCGLWDFGTTRWLL